MKPCDCKDLRDLRKLNEVGISHNDESIEVVPNHVILTLGRVQIKMSMNRFRQFAEWYLEDQEKENEDE